MRKAGRMRRGGRKETIDEDEEKVHEIKTQRKSAVRSLYIKNLNHQTFKTQMRRYGEKTWDHEGGTASSPRS